MRFFESDYPVNKWRAVVLLVTVMFGSTALAGGFRSSDLRLMLSGEISSAEKQQWPEYRSPPSALQGSNTKLGTSDSLVERNDGQAYLPELSPGLQVQLLAYEVGVLVPGTAR